MVAIMPMTPAPRRPRCDAHDRRHHDQPARRRDVCALPGVRRVAMPVETTILVVCHKYKSLDKRKKHRQGVGKKRQLRAVYVRKNKGLQDCGVDSGILQGQQDQHPTTRGGFLAEYIGAEPSKITNEIDKLRLAIGSDTEITPRAHHAKRGHPQRFQHL